jgi:hypothetical protein
VVVVEAVEVVGDADRVRRQRGGQGRCRNADDRGMISGPRTGRRSSGTPCSKNLITVRATKCLVTLLFRCHVGSFVNHLI